MPIPSPVGPLDTLEELIAELRRVGTSSLEERFKVPVLLVLAPAEEWASATLIKPLDQMSHVSIIPTVVINLDPRPTSTTQGQLTFGRSESCDIALPFSALSKVHGTVRLNGSTWEFEDVGSRNGTMLNGQKLEPRQPGALSDGAVLRFGDVTAKFVLPASFRADLLRRVQAP